MKAFKLELKRSIINPMFLLTILLQIFFLYVGGREDWPYIKELDAFYIFSVSQQLGVGHLFFPLLACLPFSLSFCFEYNSGFSIFQYYRYGKNNYPLSKISSVLISGALALGLGTFIYALICIIMSLDNSYLVEVWRTYGDGTWLEDFLKRDFGRPYLFLSVILYSIAGAFWSGFVLMISSFRPNPIISVLFTQGTYLLLNRVKFFSNIFNPVMFIILSMYQNPYKLSEIFLKQFLGILFIILISFYCIKRKMKLISFARNRGNIKMKRKLLKAIPNFFQLSPTAITVFILFILFRPIIFSNKTMSIGFELLSLLGGIKYQEVSNISDIAQWTTFLLPCFLCSGMILFQELSSRVYLTFYRYRSVKKWYFKTFLLTTFPNLIYVLFSFLWVIIFSKILGINSWITMSFAEDGSMVNLLPYVYWILPLLFIHIIFISSIQMSLSLWMRNSIIPIFIILMTIMSSVWLMHFPTQYSSFALGNLGMTLRMDVKGREMARPIIAFLIQLILSCLFIVFGLLKTKKYINNLK